MVSSSGLVGCTLGMRASRTAEPLAAFWQGLQHTCRQWFSQHMHSLLWSECDRRWHGRCVVCAPQPSLPRLQKVVLAAADSQQPCQPSPRTLRSWSTLLALVKPTTRAQQHCQAVQQGWGRRQPRAGQQALRGQQQEEELRASLAASSCRPGCSKALRQRSSSR